MNPGDACAHRDNFEKVLVEGPGPKKRSTFSSQGNPKPTREPQTPRVVELLRKAIEWRRQLDAGEVRTQAEIAGREGITRARVTQIPGLLRLAPEIQNQSVPRSRRR